MPQGQGLEIDYRVGGVEALDGAYDLVTSLEVVEHVADVPRLRRAAWPARSRRTAC